MSDSNVERISNLIGELEDIFKELSDEEFDIRLFEEMNSLLVSILDPNNVSKHPNIAEFLLTNKHRSQFLAYIRHAITHNYSFKGSKNGREAFVSPNHIQWYDDGVMFLEGKEPFLGYIGLYRNKEARYAIAARDAKEGEELTKEDLNFITTEDAIELAKKLTASYPLDLKMPINELTQMLEYKEENEHRYQEWIEKYPWIFGLQYNLVQRHTQFDNENIPDFTAVRVHDNSRDIFEIKQPFLTLFRKNGDFSSAFNDSWNQIERYLDFARENKDYLRRTKGLNIENPKCYLLIGYNLTQEKREKIRRKEKLNSSITILTYNDLIQFAENTIGFLKSRLENNDEE